MKITITRLKNTLIFLTFALLSLTTLNAQSNCDIYCPDDFAVIADDNGEYVVEDYFALSYVYLEECSAGAVVTQSPPAGTVLSLGQFEVTMTVSSEGETDDCDFDVSIIEEQTGDCDFDCPDDQIGTSDSNNEYIVPNYATNGALIVTGNCGNFTYEQDPAAGTVVGSGTYSISLVAENEAGTSTTGCNFELVVSPSLGNSEFTESSFSVFPNPASTTINFSTDVDTASIISFSGKLISTQEQTDTVDISILTSGMYILKLVKDDNVLIKKIVKQ